MSYPEKGAGYIHKPKFIERMKRAEGGNVGPDKSKGPDILGGGGGGGYSGGRPVPVISGGSTSSRTLPNANDTPSDENGYWQPYGMGQIDSHGRAGIYTPYGLKVK